MKKFTAVLAVGSLALVACGSDGGSSGEGDEARDAILSGLTAGGSEGFDEECLQEKIDGLSDDDAQFLAENLDAEEEPEGASESALEFVSSIFDCVDFSDIDLGELEE